MSFSPSVGKFLGYVIENHRIRPSKDKPVAVNKFQVQVNALFCNGI